jgi:hypothetical protein
VRSAEFSTIRLAAVLAVLIGPSCYSLPKVEVIRVIDDFAEDGGLAQPTWNVFGPWSCGSHVDRSQTSEAGQDASQDGGPRNDIDAGEAVTCTLVTEIDDMDLPIPPSTVTHALVATFDLRTSTDLMPPTSVEVVTRTKPTSSSAGDALAPSMTVNLTGFSLLIFNAKLLPITTALPTGTELHVELHCASTKDPLVDQDIVLTPGVVNWKTITLPLSAFTVGSQREACLASVESIGFIVVPGSAPAGTQVSGTLHLDEIRLQ